MTSPASRPSVPGAVVLATLIVLLSAAATGEAARSGPLHDAQNEVARLQSAAAAGDTSAMYQLGLRFQQGKGVRKNIDEAVMWFHRAAAEGNADAMLLLGFLHQNVGAGVAHDLPKAALWYGKAAKLGHGRAMFFLGTMYWAGRGVRQDMVEAYKWLDLATIYSSSEDDRKRAAASRDSLGRSKAMSAERVAEGRTRALEWQHAFGRQTTTGSGGG